LTKRLIWAITRRIPFLAWAPVLNREDLPLLPLVPRLAALVLGLLAPQGTPADFPAVGEVTVAALAVFDEPDARAFSPGNLHRGERVTIRDADREGWLTIDPPRDTFNWIEQRALDRSGPDGSARVRVSGAVVRSGRAGARLPGVPRGALAKGTAVRLLDRPPLLIGRGSSLRTWLASAPAPGEVRYVRAEGVRWPIKRDAREPIQETRVAYQSNDTLEGLPPWVTAEIGQIEAMHRAVLREPVEEWRLQPIRQRYEALLQRVSDPDAGHAIRERLAVVARHEEMAESARTIQTILERSRRRDRHLALMHRRIAAAERPESRPYEAEGMVQPSARRFQGQKVFALIGPEGTPLAYLDIPPGLDARPLVARRVGVRGAVHYDEGLQAKLISVQDLEPLDDDR
jgi:hypothetical protein